MQHRPAQLLRELLQKITYKQSNYIKNIAVNHFPQRRFSKWSLTGPVNHSHKYRNDNNDVLIHNFKNNEIQKIILKKISMAFIYCSDLK